MQENEAIIPYTTYKFVYDSSLSFVVKADFKSDLVKELGLYAYFKSAERSYFGLSGIEIIFTPNKSGGTVSTWNKSILKILERSVYGDVYLSSSEVYSGTMLETFTSEVTEGIKSASDYILLLFAIGFIIYIGMNRGK